MLNFSLARIQGLMNPDTVIQHTTGYYIEPGLDFMFKTSTCSGTNESMTPWRISGVFMGPWWRSMVSWWVLNGSMYRDGHEAHGGYMVPWWVLDESMVPWFVHSGSMVPWGVLAGSVVPWWTNHPWYRDWSSMELWYRNEYRVCPWCFSGTVVGPDSLTELWYLHVSAVAMIHDGGHCNGPVMNPWYRNEYLVDPWWMHGTVISHDGYLVLWLVLVIPWWIKYGSVPSIWCIHLPRRVFFSMMDSWYRDWTMMNPYMVLWCRAWVLDGYFIHATVIDIWSIKNSRFTIQIIANTCRQAPATIIIEQLILPSPWDGENISLQNCIIHWKYRRTRERNYCVMCN